VPSRTYPQIQDDVYKNVPGTDLGVPTRSYGKIQDDVYKSVPGQDLGAPDRSYKPADGKVYPDANNDQAPLNTQKVYPDSVKTSTNSQIEPAPVYSQTQKISSNGELRDPSNTFTTQPNAVYPKVDQVNRKSRGEIGKAYPQTTGDFIVEAPLNLGNLKPEGKYNISTGGLNPEPEKFE